MKRIIASAALAIGMIFGSGNVMAVEHDPVLYRFYIQPKPYTLTDAERQLIEQVVACEAGADSTEGQRMVAQCILDYALDHDLTVSEACSALQISTYSRSITDENRDNVSAIFDSGERVTEDHCYWWYQPDICTSSWHESQRFVIQVESGHRFFAKW